MNFTAVRVRAGVEFDIDIQHHWCWLKWRWLKWWDNLRCSPVPVVEPLERCERADADDHGRASQPLVEVPRVRDHLCALPPKQHSTSDTEIGGSPDEMAPKQMDNRLEPRGNGEAKRAPIERHHEH